MLAWWSDVLVDVLRHVVEQKLSRAEFQTVWKKFPNKARMLHPSHPLLQCNACHGETGNCVRHSTSCWRTGIINDRTQPLEVASQKDDGSLYIKAHRAVG